VASYKLNIASCRGLPAADEIVRGLEEFGLAEGEPYGVLDASQGSGAAFGTLIRRTNMPVKRIEPKTRQVLTEAVERVALVGFGAFPAAERLEAYAGSASALKDVDALLTTGLALAVVTDPIELDVLSCVEKLMKNTQRFQLRSVRVTDYAANSYMIGAYVPKFMDTDHGLQFLEDYAEALKSAQVRFAGPTARVNLTITPNACFSYSCSEDDQPAVQEIVRKLL